MWTIDGIIVYVQDIPESTKNIIARLQPVDTDTVYHFFGYEKRVFKLTAIAVGTVDKEALHVLGTESTSSTLVTPYGNVSVHINSVTTKQRYSVCQTMRADLASDAPVYDVEMELYKV